MTKVYSKADIDRLRKEELDGGSALDIFIGVLVLVAFGVLLWSLLVLYGPVR